MLIACLTLPERRQRWDTVHGGGSIPDCGEETFGACAPPALSMHNGRGAPCDGAQASLRQLALSCCSPVPSGKASIATAASSFAAFSSARARRIWRCFYGGCAATPPASAATSKTGTAYPARVGSLQQSACQRSGENRRTHPLRPRPRHMISPRSGRPSPRGRVVRRGQGGLQIAALGSSRLV